MLSKKFSETKYAVRNLQPKGIPLFVEKYDGSIRFCKMSF